MAPLGTTAARWHHLSVWGAAEMPGWWAWWLAFTRMARDAAGKPVTSRCKKKIMKDKDRTTLECRLPLVSASRSCSRLCISCFAWGTPDPAYMMPGPDLVAGRLQAPVTKVNCSWDSGIKSASNSLVPKRQALNFVGVAVAAVLQSVDVTLHTKLCWGILSLGWCTSSVDCDQHATSSG